MFQFLLILQKRIIMKRFLKLLTTLLFAAAIIGLIGCKKKSTCDKNGIPAAPNNLKATVYDDHIHLSWDEVCSADYYVITDDFHGRDENNSLIDETYNVVLGESSSNHYDDIYPFEGTNYYKVKAVNEHGSSSYSEVASYYDDGDLHVLLYPNPAINMFHISAFMNRDVPEGEAVPINHITIENTFGYVIKDMDVTGEEFTINTDPMESGIFLARVNTDYGEAVKRFVVNKE